jgi:hypothetical protein
MRQSKTLDELEGYEDFSKYSIDTDGNLWSLKYKKTRKLKISLSGKGICAYYTSKIRDDHGVARTVYIHKLVALAFIPTYDASQRVLHRDGDRANNSIDNLYWGVIIKEKKKALDFVLQEEIVNKILQVHIAAQKKGIKVGDSYSFTTQMVEDAIEAYIMQYGLRKVMKSL